MVFFVHFIGYATEVITDHDMQQEIMRRIYAGLGDTFESQSKGGHLGQNKPREKITKGYYWFKTLPIFQRYTG